jgi:hypothetical protein
MVYVICTVASIHRRARTVVLASKRRSQKLGYDSEQRLLLDEPSASKCEVSDLQRNKKETSSHCNCLCLAVLVTVLVLRFFATGRESSSSSLHHSMVGNPSAYSSSIEDA